MADTIKYFVKPLSSRNDENSASKVIKVSSESQQPQEQLNKITESIKTKYNLDNVTINLQGLDNDQTLIDIDIDTIDDIQKYIFFTVKSESKSKVMGRNGLTKQEMKHKNEYCMFFCARYISRNC